MDTFNFVNSLILAQVDFADDTFEALIESLMTASGSTQQASLLVDQTKGDTDVTEVVTGLSELAETIGKAFGQLGPDEKQTIKGAIAKLVSYPDQPELEAALEALFNNYLDTLDAVKAVNDYVANQNPA